MDWHPSQLEMDIAQHLAFEDPEVVRAVVKAKKNAKLSEPGCTLQHNYRQGACPIYERKDSQDSLKDEHQDKTFNRGISQAELKKYSGLNFLPSHYLSQPQLYEVLRFISQCPVSHFSRL